jgi:hypothetical protein
LKTSFDLGQEEQPFHRVLKGGVIRQALHGLQDFLFGRHKQRIVGLRLQFNGFFSTTRDKAGTSVEAVKSKEIEASNRQDAEDAKKTDSEKISKALLGVLAVI